MFLEKITRGASWGVSDAPMMGVSWGASDAPVMPPGYFLTIW